MPLPRFAYRRRSPGPRATRRWAPAVHSACIAAIGRLAIGCAEPEPPRLVARLGCGLEDERLGALRVQARGDFPSVGGTQVLLSEGDAELAWGDLPVDAVTVEGLFGQTVEAVGRTARLRDDGEIPVYFAPVDGVCPVEAPVEPRVGAAVAVGPAGDVLVVGGRDAQGQLLADVVRMHDEDGRFVLLPGRLPFPAVGQSVHAIDDAHFVVIGGASSNRIALDQLVLVDLEDGHDSVGEPITIAVEPELGPARAYHGAASLPDGRILIAGGCRNLSLESECAVGELAPAEPPGPGAPPTVVTNALYVTMRELVPHVEAGPELVVPRFGAQLLVSRDGVAFLVGGRDAQGDPVHVVERLRPHTTRFRRYGGDFDTQMPDDLPVVGAALQEGGVVLLALADGRIHWLTEHERDEYRPWGDWCELDGRCFDDLAGPSPATSRGLLALPGERVLADGMLLPVGGVGRSGFDAVDLFVPRPSAAAPPPPRVGTTPVLLADNSVLLVGGVDPDTGAPASPLALRLRPDLDGPDERIPEVDRATAGSMVARDPERAVVEGETLRLLAVEDDAGGAFPRVRAQARGFRSASFRFEATVQVPAGQVVPHLVLEHGAVEGVSVALERDRIVSRIRRADGSVQDVSCAATGLDFSQTQVLRVEVRPGALVIREGGRTLAQCPVGDEPRTWSVGMGAAGSGEMLVYGLRLTRL